MRTTRKIIRIVDAFPTTTKAARYVASGVLRYAKEHADLQIAFASPEAFNGTLTESKRLELWRSITSFKPDGVIIHSEWLPVTRSARMETPSIICACERVRIGGSGEHLAPFSVTGFIDDRAIVLAVKDLAVKRGHRNFAYVDTLLSEEHSRSSLRAQLYESALARDGFTLHRLTQDESDGFNENLNRMAEWLKALPKPCIVFAYADNRARDVIDACHLAHLDVPGHVNVIGVDNDPEICELTRPTLTSVQPDFEQSGYRCVQALHRLILSGRRPPRPVTFTCGVKAVVERESTQDLRGGGRLVTRAQKIIRMSFTDPHLRVSDVAAKLHVSRQLLDMRFREIVGQTVHDAIERLRIEKARRLLEIGNLTINETLCLCGYANANTFRNAFKATTGCLPRSIIRKPKPKKATAGI